MTDMVRTEEFGIDVSANQALRTPDGKVVLKHINWDQALAQTSPGKVRFVAMRAGISWGYVDPTFAYNWAALRKRGVFRAAYHVFYPNEDPVRQAEHFVNVMGGDFGEFGPVADIELHAGAHACPPKRYMERLKVYLDALYGLTGRRLVIYSRASFMDTFVTGSQAPAAWYNGFDWWLAHYLRNQDEHPGPPALPRGVDRSRVILHQTSENKVKGRGQKFGMWSDGLDYNRWIGLMGLNEYMCDAGEDESAVDEESEVRLLYGDLEDWCSQMGRRLIDLEVLRDRFGALMGL